MSNVECGMGCAGEDFKDLKDTKDLKNTKDCIVLKNVDSDTS